LNVGFLDNYVEIIEPISSFGLGAGLGMSYEFKNYSTISKRA